jgi:hypothetical protein
MNTTVAWSQRKNARECLNTNQEKLEEKKAAKEGQDAAARKEKGEDKEAGKGARISAIKGMSDTEGGKKGKKRKFDDVAEKGPNAKKKKQDEPKTDRAEPKGLLTSESNVASAREARRANPNSWVSSAPSQVEVSPRTCSSPNTKRAKQS